MTVFRLLVSRLLGPLVATIICVVAYSYVLDIHISLNLAQGILAPMEQTAQAAIWLAGAWLFNRLVVILFWEGFIRHILGRSPPRLIIQLGSVIVFLLAISGIFRFVLGESITAIWAASGAIGIVIGFALQRLILDTFSGLAINLERPFKVGDWICVHTRMGDRIGRVEETNWRTTRLWTTSRNIIIIPNSFMTSTLLTNYSMPETAARFEMDFVLDFSVPTERAVRVLSAALVSTIGSKGPLASPPPKVLVNGVTEYGVEYRLQYFLEPAQVSPRKARNTITRAVLKHVYQAGLALSYPRQDLFLAQMPWRHKSWSYLKDQIRQLSSISLFTDFSKEDLEFIAKHMSVHAMDNKSVVVRQGASGESMFILAEGLLEVLIDQPDGKQIKIADLAPGTFFGEKSLLTGQLRSATIRCVAESIVCEITKNCMMSLFERKPELAEVLARAVVERDMQNELTLSRATKEEVDSRVSSALVDMVAKIRQFFRR